MSLRIEGLDQRFTQSINAVQQSLNNSLASSSQTIQQVSERLAGIDTAAKRIVDEVGPAISSLQDVLKAPASEAASASSCCLADPARRPLLASAHLPQR
jgi:hypothetical protein